MKFLSSAVRPSSILLIFVLVTVFTATTTEGQDVLDGDVELGGDLRRGLQASEESVQKRQSKISLGVNRNGYGRLSPRLDLSHKTKNGHIFSGSVTPSGGRLGYEKTFGNGRGRIGGYVGRTFGRGGGTSFGIGGSWTFGRR
ncbi:hypothetical protein PoB_001047600 [Plakobranchus ocellatus]|uniref:Attacin C-terminal domain-containing protein n=1 Tax=Plakobranchus ocellatus TaxID=259542 RepID=A0AAV3YL04_9GAST|nr:hypothetical protein PoB_001047600 [Plakobranchus ocellatus]